MKLHCPYCNEHIVARGFGKCPSCHEELPENLQLSKREKELEEMDDDLDRKRDDLIQGSGYSGSGDGPFPVC